MKPRSRRDAFTLLELLVVLVILAIVTALAVRTFGNVEDQRRFESAQRGLEELRAAILGSPDDRAADGTRTISGFVADMGRLPRTLGTAELELRELWENPNPLVPFDVRPAVVANGVSTDDEDAQVLVPGGWRGPYIRLPLGATTLLDAWGNPITSLADPSPPNPDTTGYARLRDENNNAIITAGEEVRIVRILGANGRFDNADTGYDRDEALSFLDGDYGAAITGNVEVLDGDSPASPNLGQEITVRIFGPDPANPAQITVVKTLAPVSFNINPVTFTIPPTAGATIGPRIVRAYLHPQGGTAATTSIKRSAVQHVTLRSGVNLLNLTIDR